MSSGFKIKVINATPIGDLQSKIVKTGFMWEGQLKIFDLNRFMYHTHLFKGLRGGNNEDLSLLALAPASKKVARGGHLALSPSSEIDEQ